MKGLLSLFLLVAFLFASAPPDTRLVVNTKGLLQIIEIPKAPQSVNVAVPATLFVVDPSCNGPPAITV